MASRWRHCADLTGPGIEPQTSRTESVRLATELTAGLEQNMFNQFNRIYWQALAIRSALVRSWGSLTQIEFYLNGIPRWLRGRGADCWSLQVANYKLMSCIFGVKNSI